MSFLAPALLGLALGAASHLDQGQDALRNLDYQRAESELQQARLEPGLSRADLLRLLESYGAVEAILGNHDASIASFRELLNLDPAHVAPAKWAPKVRTPFFEAKSWQSDQGPLDLKEGPAASADGQLTALQFELTADPLHLAHTLRIHLIGSPAPLDSPVSGAGTLRARLPAQGSFQYWVELLDEHEASLITIGDGAHPRHVIRANGSDVPPPSDTAHHEGPDSGGDPLRAVELGVGGAGVAMLAVGAVFGAMVSSDQNAVNNATRNSSGVVTSMTRARAIQLDNGARTDAIVADVLFATGAVAVATGVGLWISGTFVTAAPEPKGAAVAISMRWP
jgi:hypothetical protein